MDEKEKAEIKSIVMRTLEDYKMRLRERAHMLMLQTQDNMIYSLMMLEIDMKVGKRIRARRLRAIKRVMYSYEKMKNMSICE